VPLFRGWSSARPPDVSCTQAENRVQTGILGSTAGYLEGGVPARITVGNFIVIALATMSTYLIAYPLTAILVLLGCLVATARLAVVLRLGVAFWGRLVFWLNGRRLRMAGRERIGRGGRYLVVANHSSMFDIPALLALMPGLAMIGREKLLRIPVFGFLLRAIGYIPIDTENLLKAGRSMDAAIEAARGGTSIGMFPEGTRTQTGRVQRLKRGFIHILRESGHDLLPVTIRGTFALKPKHRFTMWPRERIQLIVHEPLPNAELARLTDDQIAEKVRTILDEKGADLHEAH
jgi:1-acyl-sn-glycerol-3-phosphate acyltransferase